MAKNIFRGFIQNMLIVTPIKFHNPSFGIFFNKVHNEEGDLRYRGDTVLCRDDLYFPEVVDYLDNKYKNVPKVNVVMHACSDGEEVYSFLGVLKSRLSLKWYSQNTLKTVPAERSIKRACSFIQTVNMSIAAPPPFNQFFSYG